MQKHTLKLSTIVALHNFGWPISYYPIAECYGNSKSFTVNEGEKGGNLVEVDFGMKNPGVAIVWCETTVN